MSFNREPSTRKSKEQKFSDFFESLQLEWIVAELRYIIYPEGSRKDKSLEIMQVKKDKIKDIALRNNMKTIFEDIVMGNNYLFCPKLKESFYSKIYPEFGYPTFLYRDFNHRKQLAKFDFNCYYKIGEKFVIITGETGELVNYQIKNVENLNFNKGECEFFIMINGDVKRLSFNDLRRCL